MVQSDQTSCFLSVLRPTFRSTGSPASGLPVSYSVIRMIRPRYRGSRPACAGPAEAVALIAPRASLRRKDSGHLHLTGSRALAVVRGRVHPPARLPSRSSHSNPDAPAIRPAKRAPFRAGSRNRPFAQPDDSGHGGAQFGFFLERLKTPHEIQQHVALIDQSHGLGQRLCRVVIIARRSSSSRNSKGVAFASRLPRVGLFAAFPRWS